MIPNIDLQIPATATNIPWLDSVKKLLVQNLSFPKFLLLGKWVATSGLDGKRWATNIVMQLLIMSHAQWLYQNFSLHHLAAEFTQDCTQVSILGSRQNTSREPIHRTIFLLYQYWKLAMNATQKAREEEMECMGETGLPNIITSCCNNKKEGPPAAIIISNNNTSNDWFFDPISNVKMGVLPVAFG